METSIWSIGCILWEMAAGKTPFAGSDLKQTKSNIAKKEIVNQLPEALGQETKDFLNAFFANELPSISSLQKMPFLHDFVPNREAITE